MDPVSRVQLLASPLTSSFQSLWDGLETSCLICSPYITVEPIRQLVRTIEAKRLQDSLTVTVLTELTLANLVRGASDVAALLFVAERVRTVEIVYLPRIHAKVYVSGDKRAIISSANLTTGGLRANLEYGVQIEDSTVVRQVVADIREYAALGGQVTPNHLAMLQTRVQELQASVMEAQRSISQALQSASADLQREAEDDLLRIRARGRTIHAIFADTILFVLKRGALATEQLHEHIRDIHPDLCDDTLDRVIDGERFGKLWKHQVRTAQQYLKGKGLIVYDRERRLWEQAQAEHEPVAAPARNHR